MRLSGPYGAHMSAHDCKDWQPLANDGENLTAPLLWRRDTHSCAPPFDTHEVAGNVKRFAEDRGRCLAITVLSSASAMSHAQWTALDKAGS